jgi:hypothetical protein
MKPWIPSRSLQRSVSPPLRILSLCVIAAIWWGAAPQVKKGESKPRRQLSENAKKKILKTLASQDRNSISVFNLTGDFQRTVRTVTDDELARYASLEDFVAEINPVDTCKNPISSPPPPCIICDDGTVVCTPAKFRGAAKK